LSGRAVEIAEALAARDAGVVDAELAGVTVRVHAAAAALAPPILAGLVERAVDVSVAVRRREEVAAAVDAALVDRAIGRGAASAGVLAGVVDTLEPEEAV
jgi:hypothetical protein